MFFLTNFYRTLQLEQSKPILNKCVFTLDLKKLRLSAVLHNDAFQVCSNSYLNLHQFMGYASGSQKCSRKLNSIKYQKNLFITNDWNKIRSMFVCLPFPCQIAVVQSPCSLCKPHLVLSQPALSSASYWQLEQNLELGGQLE